jgi:hypothetical protein
MRETEKNKDFYRKGLKFIPLERSDNKTIGDRSVYSEHLKQERTLNFNKPELRLS